MLIERARCRAMALPVIRWVVFVSGALVGSLSGHPSALAQCANPTFNFGGFIVTPSGGRNVVPTASPLVSIMNTVNTAFLTNTTSFVSASAATNANQPSGGVWARAIAGTVDSKAETTTVVVPGSFDLGAGIGSASGTQNCRQTNHQDYAGFQVGADLATLNIGSAGLNWHFGVTGGSLTANAEDTTPAGANAAGDLRSHFDVPFIGLYTAVTQGNFFADAQVRWDFYQSNSSSKVYDFSGVQNEARGITFAGSAGYKMPIGSNWFFEPSVGGSWTRLSVDSVTLVDRDGIGGILRVNDIDSILGRASLRLGANFAEGIYIWQPFVAASLIHEFAGDVKSKTTFVDPSNFFWPGMEFESSTERMGTYGQIGVGTAIVVGNTGWLGYGRGDVKFGDNIHGIGFNAGLRYQW